MSADPRLALLDFIRSMMATYEGFFPGTLKERIEVVLLGTVAKPAYDLGVEQERARCLALVEELAGYTAPENLIAAIRAAASEVPPRP